MAPIRTRQSVKECAKLPNTGDTQNESPKSHEGNRQVPRIMTPWPHNISIIHRSPPNRRSDAACATDGNSQRISVDLQRRNDDESAIIGTVLGVVFFVVLLGVVGYIYCWRKADVQDLESKYGKMPKKKSRKHKKKHKNRRRCKYCGDRGPYCHGYCDEEYCQYWLDQQALAEQQALAQQQAWENQQPDIELTVPQAAYGGPTRVVDDGVNEMDAPQIYYNDDGDGWQYDNGWWPLPYNAYRRGRRKHRKHRGRSCRY